MAGKEFKVVFHPNFKWPKMSIWRDLKWWILHRTFHRYHVVRTDLEPGYHELEDRMMHSMFTMLVDFVEGESAWHDACCEGQITKWESFCHYWMPWVRYRNVERGLKHLDWAASLTKGKDGDPWKLEEGDPDYYKPTHHAIVAMETKALYLWWKEHRPNRPDPMDASGYSQIYDEERAGKPTWDENRHLIPFSDRCRAAADRSHEIEEQYEVEDEEMMKRLVAIRRSLWT